MDSKEISPKKKLLILGNSLTEPFVTSRIDYECETSKIRCMTISDAKEEVANLANQAVKPDFIYFQLITNDLESASPQTCATEMKSLCEQVGETCPDCKIIVAEAPLTANVNLNHKIGAANNLMYLELLDSVVISPAGVLSQSDKITEFLQNDATGKHLNNKGTGQLVRNLKMSLTKVKT